MSVLHPVQEYVALEGFVEVSLQECLEVPLLEHVEECVALYEYLKVQFEDLR